MSDKPVNSKLETRIHNGERTNSDTTAADVKLCETTTSSPSAVEKELEAAQSQLSHLEIFPKDLERRVRRKLDWNIIPLVMVLYTLSVLDRSNVGNARIAGMSIDLNLIGNRYDWLLTIFYIPCNPLSSLPLPLPVSFSG